jgi:alcohol dehydrogenase class IV
VARAGEAARLAGADVLVAIGGGSSLDAAKAVAAEAAEPGWIAGRDQPGQPTEVPAGVLPIIAVPTTAGTGSEVTPFSVITFTASHRKLVLSHPALLPQAALLDPTLLVSAPREARVAAGMDALTHAVESYLSKQATEATRARSLEAVVGIGAHLPGAAVEAPEPADLAGMQRAALVAGLAFSRSRLGVVHALALPLSALFGVPHGVANAILLPHGMAFNLPAAAEECGNLARAMYVKLSREDADISPQQAIAAVEDLAQRIGAPARMRDVGVDRAAIPRMAEDAARSPHLAVNPRQVQPGDLVGIYEKAW